MTNALFFGRDDPSRASSEAWPFDRTPVSPRPDKTFEIPDISENIWSISLISVKVSGGTTGLNCSTFAPISLEDNTPPTLDKAKFFSSTNPIHPVKAVGGSAALSSRLETWFMRCSRISCNLMSLSTSEYPQK